MELKSVSLIKRVKNPDGTFSSTYPISVSPTISKFGEGLEKVQLIVQTGDKKEYCSMYQMKQFCEKTLDLIKTIELGYNLMGEQAVFDAINKIYEKKAKSEAPQVIEVNDVKGIIKDGKFVPIDTPDIQTV